MSSSRHNSENRNAIVDRSTVSNGGQRAAPTISSLRFFVFFFFFYFPTEGITPLIDMVADDWTRPKSPRERTTMIGGARTARALITFGYGIMGASLVAAVALPACGLSMRYLTNVTDPGRPLPLQTYYAYDTTRSPQYELTFTCQAITMFLCILPYTGIDNFLGLLVFHVCGQLENLRRRVARLDELENFADALRSCVADHARLLRYPRSPRRRIATVLHEFYRYFFF